VNGAIRIGENVTINGGVSVVNGKIAIASGSSIRDEVSNINGEISITAAEIGGNLSTVNGDVTLDNGANLHGNLTVEKARGSRSNNARKPRIIIGPGSKVGGEIFVEREVELYISDTAEVGSVSGVMSLDQAIRFSGKRP
jgi:acetyltransferase-like isoleucine patch superfamily enzyme